MLQERSTKVALDLTDKEVRKYIDLSIAKTEDNLSMEREQLQRQIDDMKLI